MDGCTGVKGGSEMERREGNKGEEMNDGKVEIVMTLVNGGRRLVEVLME